jgi:hypothetical protein
MAFSISPGVTVSEVDLTTVVPSVLTTTGAFAGNFAWGPADKIVTVTSETQLNQVFSKPDNNTYISYFTAASFLAYGNNLKVVRAVGAAANNAGLTGSTNNVGIRILNEDAYEAAYLDAVTPTYSSIVAAAANNVNTGPFASRYPGTLGNSLRVSIADVNTFGGNTGIYSGTANTWAYASLFAGAPGTSEQAAAAGSSNDEIHIVVIDTEGYFSGTRNTVLEVFPFLSKASDTSDSLGNSNYYRNYLFNNSKYIYALPETPDPANTAAYSSNTWGRSIYTQTNFTSLGKDITLDFAGGVDAAPVSGNTVNAFDLFSNPDEVDVSLIITGGADTTVQQNAIDIASSRKDCIAFISPPSTSVVNKSATDVVDSIITWNTGLARSSSYAVADSGWKYMFDKYNNVYRWIPLNADTAGLCVYTDSVRDPWYSPAGFNRGNLKNVVKLAWNPNKTDRDRLYGIGINPVATFPGQGTVLFGDKTLLGKPSAFDRINVRRLFIVLEKAIAQASKFSMFEFNDEFTRSQFVSLVTPFLRDIQGRRGIYDFRVVCDTTNNTPQVIDSNQFVGDIYVKPARAINFIQLNFVAVRTGVDFTEVVGKF